MNKIPIRIAYTLILLMMLINCTAKDRSPDKSSSISSRLSIVEQIRIDHNKRITKIASFWSRAEFELTYQDNDKINHYESGEGHLIFHLPSSNLSLTFGKYGDTQFHLGCNNELTWYIKYGDVKSAYLCRNVNLYDNKTEPMPYLVRPVELLALAGFVKIPALDNIGKYERNTSSKRNYAVYQFKPYGWTSSVELKFDIETKTPISVKLTDDEREIVAISKLSDFLPLTIRSNLEAKGPLAPSQITITTPYNNEILNIQVLNSSDAPPKKTSIDFRIFNIDSTLTHFSSDQITILDSLCSNPAIHQN